MGSKNRLKPTTSQVPIEEGIDPLEEEVVCQDVLMIEEELEEKPTLAKKRNKP